MSMYIESDNQILLFYFQYPCIKSIELEIYIVCVSAKISMNRLVMSDVTHVDSTAPFLFYNCTVCNQRTWCNHTKHHGPVTGLGPRVFWGPQALDNINTTTKIGFNFDFITKTAWIWHTKISPKFASACHPPPSVGLIRPCHGATTGQLPWAPQTRLALNLRMWPWNWGSAKIFGFAKFCLAPPKTLCLRLIHVWN